MTRSLSYSFAVVILGIGLAVSRVAADDQAAIEKHEKVIKDIIKGLDDLTAAMESIKDDDTARSAAKKIIAICDRFDKIAEEAKNRPKLPIGKDAELLRKYEKDLLKCVAKYQAAHKNLAPYAQKVPELMDAVKRLMAVGQKLQAILLGGGN